MRVRCIHNDGEALREYEYSLLDNGQFGRFGTSNFSEYGSVSIGMEYFVMGIIIFKDYQGYLIDDNDFISVVPCQLFEVIDNNLNADWHFRLIKKNEESLYPLIQAIFGYYELCHDKDSYINLVIEQDIDTKKIYFQRKSTMF